MREKPDIAAAWKVMWDYIDTYTDQMGYQDYELETFINDMIYGLGLAIDKARRTDEYRMNGGYERMKQDLVLYIRAGAHTGDWP